MGGVLGFLLSVVCGSRAVANPGGVWEPNTTRKGLLSFSAISYLYHEFLYSGVGPP
jgi:hypothetical protein